MTHLPAFLARSMRSALATPRGVALLMVLFVVVALTSLVVSLTDTTQQHLHLAQYYKNRLQAFWTAQSGIQAAVAILQVDAQLQRTYDAYDSPWNCESTAYQENALLFLSVPLCGNSLIDPALTLSVEDPALDVQQPRTRCPIVDENRKLSLFPLVKNRNQPNEQTDPATFDRVAYLLRYLVSEEDLRDPGGPDRISASWVQTDAARRTPISLDQARTLAGHLVDWIDSPGNTSPMDLNPDRAETACPEDGLPYEAKNGMMDSVDEIALVCGFRQMPRHVVQELGRNLTVFDLTTNVNTATRPVLHAFCAQIEQSPQETYSEAIHLRLHPIEDQLPESVVTADDIATYRAVLGPVVSSDALIQELQKATGVVSEHFRIGINGLVVNVGTGAVDAVAGVTMIVGRGRAGLPGGLRLYYYREG